VVEKKSAAKEMMSMKLFLKRSIKVRCRDESTLSAIQWGNIHMYVYHPPYPTLLGNDHPTQKKYELSSKVSLSE